MNLIKSYVLSRTVLNKNLNTPLMNNSERENDETRVYNLIKLRDGKHGLGHDRKQWKRRWKFFFGTKGINIVSKHLVFCFVMLLNYATTTLIFKLNENYMLYITIGSSLFCLLARASKTRRTLLEYIIKLASLNTSLPSDSERNKFTFSFGTLNCYRTFTSYLCWLYDRAWPIHWEKKKGS